MSKIIVKEFPKEIAKCLKDVRLDVIKTRVNGNNTYFYEVSEKNTKKFVLNPNQTYKDGYRPELEDTWCGGQWDNGKYKGCDFDFNIFDKNVYGDDNTPGLMASLYSCEQEGEYASTNTNDYIHSIPVRCFFEENGKRTEFKCDDAEHYIELFGKWDGKEVPKFKPVEMTVTCLMKVPTHFDTVAASKAEAKQAAVEALTKGYHEMGIDGEIEIISVELKRTTKKKV